MKQGQNQPWCPDEQGYETPDAFITMAGVRSKEALGILWVLHAVDLAPDLHRVSAATDMDILLSLLGKVC